MVTTAGVGHSQKSDSMEAGAEAARFALDQAKVKQCDLAILYATTKHDPTALRDGVRSVIGKNARIVGGASMGIITPTVVSYGGCEVGVAVISSDSVKADLFIEHGLPNNESRVGAALGKQIAAKGYGADASLMLMFDSVREAPAGGMPQINLGSRLLSGLAPEIASFKTVAGHGMLGDSSFSPAHQWFDDRISQNSALALVLSGAKMDVEIAHGCKPASGYYRITKSEGNVVFEIDGKPALTFARDLLGTESGNIEEYPLFLTLGRNMGDKFGESREENYVNRPLMAVDERSSSLVLGEADLSPGTEVQLMRRSIDFTALRKRWEDLLARVRAQGRQPFLALYYDCAGRSSMFANTEREEAEEAQRVIAKEMPLLGVYSGCEIARVGGHLMSLHWTGVMALLSA